VIRRAASIVGLATFAVSLAHALPLSQAEVTKLCNEAEGLAHCGRLVEAEQLKRLPGLAVRDGNTLRISLFPAGQVTFTDVDTLAGGSSFALWDHYSGINATLLFTTKDDDASFVLLQRATGKQTPLPSEPALAPDRQRLATADFCETRCENRLVVWRISRDGAVREAEWKPADAWADAAVRWQDSTTLVVEYTPVGASESKTLERKLGEPGWTPLTR
jgi:hypothetical protein